MNRFVSYFKLKEKFQDIKPFKCVFKGGLNIIVGENGSGKSTMLKLMANKKEKFFQVKLVNSGQQVDTRFLDTETQNPRFAKEYATKNIFFEVMSHFSSHGESILPLVQACRSFKDSVIFVDEPEAGISIKNQFKVLQAFEESEKNGCQLIVTTHSYVIINNAEEVFCLDNFQWIDSKKYLKKVLREAT